MHKVFAVLFALFVSATAHAAITNCVIGTDESAVFGTANFGNLDPLAPPAGPITATISYFGKCTRTENQDPQRVDFQIVVGNIPANNGLGVTASYSSQLLTLTWAKNERNTQQVNGTATFTLTGLTNTTSPGALTFTQETSTRVRTCDGTNDNNCTGYGGARIENAFVLANITRSCNIAPMALNFGNIKPSSVADRDATSNSSVVCTRTTPFLVKFSGGNAGPAGARNMVRAGVPEPLRYEIFSEAARTTPLTGNTGIGNTGTGTAQLFTVYGRVFRNQFLTPGAYTDRLTMTVEY